MFSFYLFCKIIDFNKPICRYYIWSVPIIHVILFNEEIEVKLDLSYLHFDSVKVYDVQNYIFGLKKKTFFNKKKKKKWKKKKLFF